MSGEGKEQPQISIEMAEKSAESRSNESLDNVDFKPFDVKWIRKILNYIKKNEKLNSLTKIRFTAEQAQNAIDISTMEQKVYESVEEFEKDVKGFVRQCRSRYPQWPKIHTAPEELIQNVKGQIQVINACVECYRYVYDFCTEGAVANQCTNRHLLVWAKAQAYDGYCPAKVLAVNAEDETVCIQYFGDHSCFSLPMKDGDFYLYSNECPEKKRGARPQLLSKALRDVNQYIRSQNVNFNYAKPHTMFKPDKLNDSINEMFAGEKTDSTSDSGSSDIGYNKTKRFKRIRYAFSDMDKMDEVDTMKRNLKLHMDNRIEHEAQRVKRAIDSLKKEKKDLKRKNATLMGEKDQLERKIATLNEEKRNANDKICAFEKKIAELVESRRKDTEIFDQEKRDLELKNVECANQLCIEKRKFDREKKTLSEDYEALKKVQVEEKKTLEERNKALTQQLNAALQQNAAFAMDISNQKKKHDDKKRALEESFELFKTNWLEAMQQ